MFLVTEGVTIHLFFLLLLLHSAPSIINLIHIVIASNNCVSSRGLASAMHLISRAL
jgi:hypothetical protein